MDVHLLHVNPSSKMGKSEIGAAIMNAFYVKKGAKWMFKNNGAKKDIHDLYYKKMDVS